MNDIKLRIMIIDDNPAIHHDFIKVLTASSSERDLYDIERQLFDDEDFSAFKNNKEEETFPDFIIDTASQGKEGLEKIKLNLKKKKHYALAFVDVRMPPGWDGIETIKRIWEVDPDIQIVICTAFSDYSWEETVAELGMGDNYLILKKPFDSVAVRQLACALTRKWILAKNERRHTEILQQTVQEKTESLYQSLSLLRSTIESSADGILVLDLNKKVIDYNSKFRNMWNIPKSMLKTKNGELIIDYMLDNMVDPHPYLKQMGCLEKKMDESDSQIIHFKNGKILESYSQPHQINGNIVGRVWSFRDITKQIHLEQKLEFQATHDTLTHLPNRVLLVDRIRQSIEFAKRHKKNFAVIFFDLDRFKLINDSLSHEAGDHLLCLIGKRLSDSIRKEDTIARLGGDEFVMIIPELDGEEKIINVANKILALFAKPFKIANREVTISPSIGISVFPSDGKTVNKLLKNADLAMYRAKERGGNQFQFYTPQLNQMNSKRFKLEAELHQAVKRNEFILFYQPQFNIDKQEMQSVEALIRWEHPEKGLLLPLDFIPIAEESGLIVLIGEWVIREVCRQLKEWRKKGLTPVRIAINVATQQLKQENFATTVKNILDEYQIDPQYIELEITENVVITHMEIIEMINRLKEIGVKIVLDDFGTGNSSLNYLKRIQIDRLKIDRSFIQNISTSRSDEAIIEAIIAMAKSFNFKVLAEGVECQKQMSFLKYQRCDEVQGFLFGKPSPASTIEKYIQQISDKEQKSN
ncbi:EAL domain-containing protein [Legionella israelensis]|uniref:cyclic-guanylate-specific phosphodiesterase n=1 Tax=Legionella israelensis TaxID=454 RepID=A0AAX1EGK9_9GAMM|nr:EAL domain-containing protein [Legionella israelensis]QBR84211.1 EAL domain-containing protein [Legionella israelensis]